MEEYQKVKLYTSSKIVRCPFCIKAKEFLNSNHIEYEEIDWVTNKEERKKMFKKTHSYIFPQLLIGEDTFIGFGPPMLSSIIESLKVNRLWINKHRTH